MSQFCGEHLVSAIKPMKSGRWNIPKLCNFVINFKPSEDFNGSEREIRLHRRDRFFHFVRDLFSINSVVLRFFVSLKFAEKSSIEKSFRVFSLFVQTQLTRDPIKPSGKFRSRLLKSSIFLKIFKKTCCVISSASSPPLVFLRKIHSDRKKRVFDFACKSDSNALRLPFLHSASKSCSILFSVIRAAFSIFAFKRFYSVFLLIAQIVALKAVSAARFFR